MTKSFVRTVSIAAALMFACVAISAEGEKEKKGFECKCPVSDKPASKDHAVKYKGGEVYLCCENCPAAFEKDTAKYAVKANLQLVGTKQAKEVKCPLTGGKLNPETAVEVVPGVKVCFCCNNCKGKFEKAEGDEKLALVFSDAAFEKGFKVGSKKEKKDKGDE